MARYIYGNISCRQRIDNSIEGQRTYAQVEACTEVHRDVGAGCYLVGHYTLLEQYDSLPCGEIRCRISPPEEEHRWSRETLGGRAKGGI